MAIMALLSKHTRTFTYPMLSMASGEWEPMSDGDPWKASSIVSAIVELLLSILLLLGAAIAFVTSRFVKFFNIEPPCTYIGCSHYLYSESSKSLRSSSFRSDHLCSDELWDPSRIYSKIQCSSHYNHDNDEVSGSGGSDGNVVAIADHSDDYWVSPCGCSDSDRSFHTRRRCSERRVQTGSLSSASITKMIEDSSSLVSKMSTIRGACDDRQFLAMREQDENLGFQEEGIMKGTYANAKNDDIDIMSVTRGASIFVASCMDKDPLMGACNHGADGILEDTCVDDSRNLERETVNLDPCSRGDLQETSVNGLESELHAGNLVAPLPASNSSEAVNLGGMGGETINLDPCSGGALQETSVNGLESELYASNLVAPLPASNSSEAVHAVHGGGMGGEPANEVILSMSIFDGEQDDEGTSVEENQEEGMETLKEALEAERTVLATLEAELENERNAAAVATSEAMAMISRLQEEKSVMQMEAAQLQRMSEEKAEYDEQAMELLKEILFKREKENLVLEKEVQLYRERLSVEKGIQLKRSSSNRENGSSSSLKPLLLRNEEEHVLSPTTRESNPQQALVEQLDQPYSEASKDMEEPYTLLVDQKTSKRARDSPRRETLWDNAGTPIEDASSGCFHGQCSSYEQLKWMGRSVSFTTHDEETHSLLDHLWVLEEELSRLREKEGSERQKFCPEQGWGVLSGHALDGKRGMEELEGEEPYLPIHDVYEVEFNTNRSPPSAEEPKTYVRMEPVAKPRPLSPSNAKERKEIPPCLAMVGEPANSEEASDLHLWQSLVAWEERYAEREEIQHLTTRLQALEEDRDLLRETMETFKHRDAELNLLEEIAEHLRELRMAGFKTILGDGGVSGEISAASPGKTRALKKRRFCSGPGQTPMVLLQQKNP